MTPDSPKPLFIDPYANLSKPELTRLAVWTSLDDHNFLFHTLHPGHGSVTIVTNMLVAKFCKALRNAKITDHATQRMDFERFIAECEVRMPKVKKLKIQGE